MLLLKRHAIFLIDIIVIFVLFLSVLQFKKAASSDYNSGIISAKGGNWVDAIRLASDNKPSDVQRFQSHIAYEYAIGTRELEENRCAAIWWFEQHLPLDNFQHRMIESVEHDSREEVIQAWNSAH